MIMLRGNLQHIDPATDNSMLKEVAELDRR